MPQLHKCAGDLQLFELLLMKFSCAVDHSNIKWLLMFYFLKLHFPDKSSMLYQGRYRLVDKLSKNG